MKSGFVAIVGEPNVGKSSLLNTLINYDLAITSPMIQTTRDQIKGIYNSEKGQIVFIDTPGIHFAKHVLGKHLNKQAWKAIKDSDINLALFDISNFLKNEKINEKSWEKVSELISKLNLNKTIIVMTKIDLIKEFKDLEKIAYNFKKLGAEIITGVSYKIPESIESLINAIFEKLPVGEPFYNEEDISDVNLRFMAKEIIRKKIIKNTFEEIPHKVAVVIDEFNEPISEIDNEKDNKHEENVKNNQTIIKATIFVERESQKKIIIGHQGKMIKNIGIQAREDLKKLLSTNVHLELTVKISSKWTQDEKKLKKLGY